MTKIVIEGVHTQIGRAVSLYGAYLLKDTLNSYSFVGISRPDDDQHRYDLTLPQDVSSEIPYKTSTVTITYIKKSEEPISYDSGTVGFFIEVHLEAERKDILIQFMDDARQHVKDVMLGNRKSAKKIACYVFDKMWLLMNRRVKRPIDTVYLKKNMLKEILTDVEKFLDPKTGALYHSLGRPYKRNYMLEGLAGTGKTTLIYAIASTLDMSVAILNFNTQVDDNVFIKAMQRLPDNSILVLEDVDCLFEERKKNEDHRSMITFSGLLNILDGLMHKDGLLTFMTTNYKNKLDGALIRPGRVDRVYHFDFMSKEQIKKMCEKYMITILIDQEEEKQSEQIKQFISKIGESSLKLTPAILQEYLFTTLMTPDKTIVTNFPFLRQIITDHVKEDKSDNYFN